MIDDIESSVKLCASFRPALGVGKFNGFRSATSEILARRAAIAKKKALDTINSVIELRAHDRNTLCSGKTLELHKSAILTQIDFQE